MVHVRAYEQNRDGREVRVSECDRHSPEGSGGSGQGTKQPRESSLDVDKFADALDKNAGPKSELRCGVHVREALAAGGVVLPKIGSAKDFGPELERHGFKPMDEDGYAPQKGDIVVIQPYEGGNKNGHIAAYDGKQWVSDFKQRDFWGGPGYRTLQPSHRFYRVAP